MELRCTSRGPKLRLMPLCAIAVISCSASPAVIRVPSALRNGAVAIVHRKPESL